VLYCATVEKSGNVSEQLVRWLQKTGFGEPSAWLLEALGPLAVLGAQVMYILAPLFPSDRVLTELAGVLEDPHQRAHLMEALLEPMEEA
jgi:hypothetical protein